MNRRLRGPLAAALLGTVLVAVVGAGPPTSQRGGAAAVAATVDQTDPAADRHDWSSRSGLRGPSPAAGGASGGNRPHEGTGDLADARGVRFDPDLTGPGAEVEADPTPYSVIGEDDRRRVTMTTAYPARAVVYVTQSTSWCTGYLYAANMVATAGHCVHGGPGADWKTDFRVYPGRNGSHAPYGYCGVLDVFATVGWTRDGSIDHDYAALRLDCTVGATTGWFGHQAPGPIAVGATTVTQGYPQDLAPTASQWQSVDEVRRVTDHRVYHHNDTFGGQSGAPIYLPASSCHPCAVAVHAYGWGVENSGTRITEEVLGNLTRWQRA
ncbi:trypsin-like serine peptidase [Actinoalloteichus spitiensis]|uniref:trypsin-like serine peptidase n=1 Tax=Actinoalloteichus spitiensis TaxID=252394 RepID=UPI00037BF37C|nr:trypsin-like serine protease [Actinoalloteichus spitiensis]